MYGSKNSIAPNGEFSSINTLAVSVAPPTTVRTVTVAEKLSCNPDGSALNVTFPSWSISKNSLLLIDHLTSLLPVPETVASNCTSFSSAAVPYSKV